MPMLEDDFTYVIRKALKGLALAPGEAALRAGLVETDVLSLLRGKFSADTARRLAPVLGLNPEALARHPDYAPRPLHLHTIRRLDLPFDDGDRVNAWLIRDEDTALLFDTGYVSGTCAAALDRLAVSRVDAAFATHAHRDHIAGIPDLAPRCVKLLGPGIPGTEEMKPGDTVRCGLLTVRACDLSGHFTPTLGYFIEGLTQPVLVTGDALFAGSIGGCADTASYQLALERLREVLSPLPDRTLLLPGHGPVTTLGEERGRNPFAIGW